ncbi:MAG TPA: glycosyltransferase [Planctomycetota bacterium]
MPLSILIVTGSLYQRSNGVHWSVIETAGHLQSEGARVVVIGEKDSCLQGHPEDYAGLSTHACARAGPESLHYSPGLSSVLRKLDQRPDVVVMNGVWVTNYCTAARWAGARAIPYLLTLHGTLSPAALAFSRWKKWLATRTFAGSLLRNAACLQALTVSEEQQIRNYGCRNPVCVIPNGVRIDETPAGRRQELRDGFLRRLGAQRVLLYLGRVDPIKGLDLLLKAWQQCRANNNGWKLAIAGPGRESYLGELRGLAATLRLNNVEFLGALYGEQKRAAFLGADCFVLPSRSEALPMAALEAMAHRAPVLVTDACSGLDLVRERAGIEVPCSVDGLQNGLDRFLDMNDGERQSMVERASLLLRRNYHWPDIARQLLDVYAWMAGQGPKPETVHLA